MMSFAESLKRLRRERGITQSQLAEALGLSKSAVSMYECGNREPELEVLESFADFFGVDLNALMGRDAASGDPELTEYLEMLRTRKELRMLFSLTKDTSREDVEQAVRILEAIRGGIR